MIKKLFRRKRYLINPQFQLNFIARVMVLTLAVLAIIYGAQAYLFWEFRQEGLSMGLPADHVYFAFIDRQQMQMNIMFGVAAILVATVLGYGGILLSHRVAGPLYRLNMHMRQVAAGEHQRPVSFRKGDFFPEIAEAYNLQLNALSKADPPSTDAVTPVRPLETR